MADEGTPEHQEETSQSRSAQLTEEDLRISPASYSWTGRTMDLLRRVLSVNIKLHHQTGEVDAGDIFLFNHFARFETFIPQYLIYEQTGALSRSVAAAEFFAEDDAFARYLLSLGAVPNDYPRLLPFLAKEVIRGRKLVVFPEGGMVKDRRVVDERGRYSVYSRSASERRKHHTGAAVIALAVEAFKAAVRLAREREDDGIIQRWVADLELDGVESLFRAATRPTRIVPANITFYPIRVTENLLKRGAELFLRGLDPRTAEELLIEGNILLSHTDMDIRLGAPVCPDDFLSRPDRWLLRHAARSIGSLEGLFEQPGRADWRSWWNHRARKHALRIRDAYMVGMYGGVTVNLSHIAAKVIYRLLDRQVWTIEEARFRRITYVALKRVQATDGVHLHRSLRNPESYTGLLEAGCAGLDQFFTTASELELVAVADREVRFLDELQREFDIDEIRIENPIAVYANEVAPVASVGRAIDGAVRDAPDLPDPELARLRFDDELRAWAWDRQAFDKAHHAEVNQQESATADPEPFLLTPEGSRRRTGILLVHGFTASPAEVRPLADALVARGHVCLGLRLKGHGTSPWDLAERRWEDWLQSVRRGFSILSALAEQVVVVGFSAGGDLGLLLAAEQPRRLVGAVAVCAPLEVRDRSMALVPLVHGANVLVESVSSAKGVKMFHAIEPEHPQINYRHMPIRALYEFRQLMDKTEAALGTVACPLLVIQSTEDPTVVPQSAETICDQAAADDIELVWIPSDRHGLLYENVGETWERTLRFVEMLDW